MMTRKYAMTGAAMALVMIMGGGANAATIRQRETKNLSLEVMTSPVKRPSIAQRSKCQRGRNRVRTGPSGPMIMDRT